MLACAFKRAHWARAITWALPFWAIDQPSEPQLSSWSCELDSGHTLHGSEPVQLGHHQGVASPAGRKGESQSWLVAVGAGSTVIDIDAIITDTKRVQVIALGGEILLLRWHACVSHQ
jgi:hypothetical protein